jgi:hypothetical protein
MAERNKAAVEEKLKLIMQKNEKAKLLALTKPHGGS